MNGVLQRKSKQYGHPWGEGCKPRTCLLLQSWCLDNAAKRVSIGMEWRNTGYLQWGTIYVSKVLYVVKMCLDDWESRLRTLSIATHQFRNWIKKSIPFESILTSPLALQGPRHAGRLKSNRETHWSFSLGYGNHSSYNNHILEFPSQPVLCGVYLSSTSWASWWPTTSWGQLLPWEERDFP